MSYYYSLPLIVDSELDEARRMLGQGMTRIVGYFQEDGAKSIAQIEQAFATGNAAALVIPAHTLKGESRQFGAKRLGDLAEAIEKTARHCVEHHQLPNEVESEVTMLRGCFNETLSILMPSATAPAAPAPVHFQPHVASYGHAAPQPPRAAGPRTFGRRIG